MCVVVLVRDNGVKLSSAAVDLLALDDSNEVGTFLPILYTHTKHTQQSIMFHILSV